MDWLPILSMIASAATIIAAIAVTVTAAIYYGQLKAMVKARQLESILVIMKYDEGVELRRTRYFVAEHCESLRALLDVPFSWPDRHRIDKHVRELSAGKQDLEAIDDGLNSLNNVCFLIRKGYAPFDILDAFAKNTISYYWRALEPYIQRRRQRTDAVAEPTRYAQHVEWVVRNRLKLPSARNSIRLDGV